MAMVCKDLGVLPGPGGIFDQDVVHMRWLLAGLEALRKAENFQAKQANNRQRKHR